LQFGLKMKTKILVIGLGYVGLPLALNLAKHYQIYGYDNSETRISELKKKRDRNNEIKKKFFLKKKIKFFSDKDKLPHDSNIFIVTVPTPVDNLNKPDLKALFSACVLVSKKYKRNDIVIIESTIAPGTTENFCLNIISKNTKIKKNNIKICFSPERMNPGDTKNQLLNFTKVLSGNNKQSVLRCKKIYQKVFKDVFIADTIKTAELGKLFENIQRDVNISLTNEIYKVCDYYNINCKNLLETCRTKWNFLNFNPGLVGGHCVSVDPYYLIDNLKKKNKKIDLISKSRQVNEDFINYIFNKLLRLIKDHKSKKILFCGIGFKDNVIDIRNSKYLSLLKKLNLTKLQITVYKDKNQLLKEKYSYTDKLNFHDYDTIIIGSKNQKIFRYINTIKSKLKNKLVINIFGKNLPINNKQVKIIDL
jgi:UDP-N-acetyl-D-glucosamine/UDP-N-acetyl-D-galactosamine dehydrogenase